ncbi:MAG TPA: hypothetical protein VNX67_08805 [Solirubrobacteraceae bacterium]|jgi:hypothetical protein|nr:hypothetical protein [Solirubrobacteraceae bacterium]
MKTPTPKRRKQTEATNDMTNNRDPEQSRRAADDGPATAPAGYRARYEAPSRRTFGVLVAGVFATGLIAGAALGPAPSSSSADSSSFVQRVIALLAARASEGAGAAPANATSTGQAAGFNGAGTAHDAQQRTPHAKPAATSTQSTASGSSGAGDSSPGASGAGSEPSSPSGEGQGERAPARPVRLPPIQHVWSIDLAGSTFAAATAAPAGYPYLVGQLLPRGTLLTSYTALDAYELAGDATLLPGGVGASLDAISEPTCPIASPAQSGTACPAGSQPSPSEADAFLQRIVEPILASPAYDENGLIVISFAPVSSSVGTPATTFSLQPTAGALLLSPLLHKGAHSASPFNSLLPRASLATIFTH